MIRYDPNQAALYREKLLARVQTDVRDCYQCGNCSASCPAAFTFDIPPNQLMRMLQVGLLERVLGSSAIQLCVQCLTCSARCPRNIDVAGIFEDLKTVASAEDRDVPEHAMTFNKAFMGAVARFGRLPELYMMGMFYLGTLKPKMALGDMGLALPMVSKGKMEFVPKKARGADEVRRIYEKAMSKARAREKGPSASVIPSALVPAGSAAAAADGGAPAGRPAEKSQVVP